MDKKDINKEDNELDFEALEEFENESDFDLEDFEDNNDSEVDLDEEDDFEELLSDDDFDSDTETEDFEDFLQDEEDDFEKLLEEDSKSNEAFDMEKNDNSDTETEDFEDLLEDEDGNELENLLEEDSNEDFEDLLEDDSENELESLLEEESNEDFEDLLEDDSENELESLLEEESNEDFEDLLEDDNESELESLLEEDSNEDFEDILEDEDNNDIESKEEVSEMKEEMKEDFDLNDFEDDEELENEDQNLNEDSEEEIELEDYEEDEVILKTNTEEQDMSENKKSSKSLLLFIGSLLGLGALGGGAYYYLNMNNSGSDFVEDDLSTENSNLNNVENLIEENKKVEKIEVKNVNKQNDTVNFNTAELDKKIKSEADYIKKYVDQQLLTMGKTITSLDNKVLQLSRENKSLRNNVSSVEELNKHLYKLESTIEEIKANKKKFEENLNNKVLLTMKVTKKVYEDAKKLDIDRSKDILEINKELANIKYLNSTDSSKLNEVLLTQIEEIKNSIEKIRNSQQDLDNNYNNKLLDLENKIRNNASIEKNTNRGFENELNYKEQIQEIIPSEEKNIKDKKSVVELLTENANTVAKENQVTIPLSVKVGNNNQQVAQQVKREEFNYSLVGVIENTLYLKDKNDAIAGYVEGEFLPGYGKILYIGNEGVVKTEKGLVDFSK